jgi:hypothetical protein
MMAMLAYTIGMESIQYTIRGIPEELDRKLRQEARETGTSVNKLVLETLKKAKLPTSLPYHDLDWFFLSDNEVDEEEDAALRWLNSLPRDLPE